ncbi:Long-chain-fatty-acid--CoA ligase [Variovorax sp. SRS16]|uniref:class I adenylate-forming enzyme family protein n=1 Tax=Variovorax sp. SRS16 TaxID=282217 RepID=UPI0013192824|nr:class I adenylate-forming enzyme family protein [Variovorax sp. SRS16]VTU22544.1 Long-chain-fatty-acid--CoA ligase [Variovorax sp. SRS16]
MSTLQQASPPVAAPADIDTPDASQRWGRTVETVTVAGHPCRAYAHRPRSIPELLRDARRWGHRPFVIEGERRLDFLAFEAAVQRVASALRARGIAQGDRVVLLAYNSLEWLVAFWALQSLGAVTVLANAWWGDDETREALATVDPVAVLTDREGARALDPSFRPMDLRALRSVIDASESVAALPPTRLSEDDLAIIMFSSGTTGVAKGVMMSHRGVIANIQNLLALTGRLPNELPMDKPGTVSLLTVPLFHLAGIQISLSTLLSGGSLVFLEGRFDPLAILNLIQREKVRVWGSIPTMVSRVVEHERFAEFDTSSLRSIPMGGAAISVELREKVQRAFPATKKSVGSLYGLTEAGGVLAAGSGDDVKGRPGCVGKPLPVVELRIADADASGAGEIFARTPTVTLGYWGDPVPIADADGWVKTGDLGRVEDGHLYVVGRSKDIVIRGGENIACAHVEHGLQTHPDVVEVAVVGLPHADLGEEVAAVVVLREGASANVEDLRRHAAAHLGKFEVPSRWWLRSEALPTNATGKIFKRDLPRQWAGD